MGFSLIGVPAAGGVVLVPLGRTVVEAVRWGALKGVTGREGGGGILLGSALVSSLLFRRLGARPDICWFRLYSGLSLCRRLYWPVLPSSLPNHLRSHSPSSGISHSTLFTLSPPRYPSSSHSTFSPHLSQQPSLFYPGISCS